MSKNKVSHVTQLTTKHLAFSSSCLRGMTNQVLIGTESIYILTLLLCPLV